MTLRVEFVPPQGPPESVRFTGTPADHETAEGALQAFWLASDAAYVSGQPFVHTPDEINTGIREWSNATPTAFGRECHARTISFGVATMVYRGIRRAHRELAEARYCAGGLQLTDREVTLHRMVGALAPIEAEMKRQGLLGSTPPNRE